MGGQDLSGRYTQLQSDYRGADAADAPDAMPLRGAVSDKVFQAAEDAMLGRKRSKYHPDWPVAYRSEPFADYMDKEFMSMHFYMDTGIHMRFKMTPVQAQALLDRLKAQLAIGAAKYGWNLDRGTCECCGGDGRGDWPEGPGGRCEACNGSGYEEN